MKNTRAAPLVFILLTVLQGLLAETLKPSINPARTGDNVTLELSPASKTQAGIYMFNGIAILVWTETSQQIFKNYSDRISFDNGTLTLRSVTVADSGLYEMQSITPFFQVTTSLTVLDPVSNVTVTANATTLVEFNDTVSLRCSSLGTSLTFRWLSGTSDISVSERVQLSDGNQTLTISKILTSDKGPFYCVVSNAISNMTSEPLSLNISYGPDNVTLTIGNSNINTFQLGSNLTFLCSADSRPSAQFQWDLNGKRLEQGMGHELKLKNMQPSESGNYTCWAFNPITLRYSSDTKEITIENSALEQVQLSTSLLLSSLLAVALVQFPW